MNRKRLKLLSCVAALFLLLAVLLLKDGGAAVKLLGEYLRYRFIRRALLVGVPVALCSAVLGVVLVLKRYSMIGDGLSHVGFAALTMAAALGCITEEALRFLPEGMRAALLDLFRGVSENPMGFTLVVVMICAVGLLRLSARGEMAVALVSTSALALGVVITSTVSGMNVDVQNYLFGSILAVSEADVLSGLMLSAAVLVLFTLLYPRIFSVTFDETFYRAGGGSAQRMNLLIAMLTAVTVVLGMRLMGTMLISGLIIFPALTALKLCASFRKALGCAAVVSLACFVIGLLLSCLWSLPAGAGIVGANLAAYLVAWFAAKE